MQKGILLFFALSWRLVVPILADQMIEHPEWKANFDANGVTGTIVVNNLLKGETHVYNPQRAAEPFIPASTYKIPHSLIALETGVVKDEHQSFKWDGQRRWVDTWNRDQTFRSALKYSVVWVYQEIARQVGEQRESDYLKKFAYGNEDVSGGVDHFWLDGSLRITALQQIEFLKKLYLNQLPVSERSILIVKDMLINEANSKYILRAKTGWENAGAQGIGWWVGWIETDNDVHFFALNLDITKEEDAPKRMIIARQCLASLGALQ
ncbi:MAG TPA: class D beta-lactamase [Chthoniobacterales bacterium]|nr:class D beta-lactamase [Chthoniobacterales bacterium]